MNDAVFAFYRYEESVFSRSGYSYLGLVPLDSIVEGSLNKVLGREKDFSMRELEAFVMEYSVDEGVLRQMVLGVGSLWQEEDRHVIGGMEGWVDGWESLLATYKLWLVVVMADDENYLYNFFLCTQELSRPASICSACLALTFKEEYNIPS